MIAAPGKPSIVHVPIWSYGFPKPAMACPFVRRNAMPCAMPSIASVEMNETTLSFQVISPLIAPARTAAPSAPVTPSQKG